jgi:hypothetical protein
MRGPEPPAPRLTVATGSESRVAAENSKPRQARPVSKPSRRAPALPDAVSKLAEIEREYEQRPLESILWDQSFFDAAFLAEWRAAEELLKHIDEYNPKQVRTIARKYPWLLFHLPDLVRSTQARKAAAISRDDGLTRAISAVLANSTKVTATSLPAALQVLGRDENARSKIPLADLHVDDDSKRIHWQDDESSAMKSAPISGLKKRLLRIRRKIREGRA